MFTTLTHVDTEKQASGISLLSFRRDSSFSFKAGQYGLWLVRGSARPFTIASAPSDEFVQLGTNLESGSPIKRKLAALRPGDRVRLIGPMGKIAPPVDNRPVVFISQGVGVTPARALLRQPSTRPRALLHLGRPHFQEELETKADSATYVRTYADLEAELPAIVQHDADAHYVLAGSPNFVGAVTRDLTKLGVSGHNVRKDAFLGLKDQHLATV